MDVLSNLGADDGRLAQRKQVMTTTASARSGFSTILTARAMVRLRSPEETRTELLLHIEHIIQRDLWIDYLRPHHLCCPFTSC